MHWFARSCWVCACFLGLSHGENPIKHLIVLMMENRSFDHLLGWLKQDYSDEIEGLTGSESNCALPNKADPNCVTVGRNGYDVSPDDPGHSFQDTAQEIYGWHKPNSVEGVPLMDGFVKNALFAGHNLSNPMEMFTKDSNSAPVLNTLAEQFAVFNYWFCSVPGPTDPNRGFAMSGTADGMVTNFNGTQWSQKSYFQFLREHGVTWAGYYTATLWALGYFKDTSRLPNSARLFPIDQFYQDVQEDGLASFVWLQPSLVPSSKYGPPTWQHPDASVAWGEQQIQRVYEALRDSAYWNSSALLITYDEHGGFYDHVPPPQTNVPPPDGVASPDGFKFDRLGVRVPTVLVSPWVKPGSIIGKPDDGSQWESTSTLATASKLFGITDHISARSAWAATFDDLFTAMDTPTSPQDAPHFDSPAKKTWTQQDLQRHLDLPVNDALHGEVLFHCLAQGGVAEQCPKFTTQRDAADYILEAMPRYMRKIQSQ